MMQGLKVKNAEILFSFDDFNPDNVKLACELHDRGIPATFFIETRGEEERKQIKTLSQIPGIEIGCHTMNHPADMKEIPLEEARGEITVSKKIIENITNKRCEAFAYPRGRYNENVKNLVKNAGFEWARTTRVLMETKDPFETHTSVHIYNGRKEYDGKKWDDIALELIRKAAVEGGKIHIWGHVREMQRDGQIEFFLMFLDLLKKADDSFWHLFKEN